VVVLVRLAPLVRVYAGLVQTDASFWRRSRVFAVYVLVFGFTAPALQKYSFGLGHGYSALPFYAGVTIAAYLFREGFRAPLFLLIGLLLGQSHYIFRLHLVYPLALVATLLLVGWRANLWKSAALVVGVVLGMLPEKLFLPAQGYDPQFCFEDIQHVAANAWQAFSQSSVHAGTLPYGLVESEHALWFVGRRPIPAEWVWWGERVGAGLLAILLATTIVRSVRSPAYLIFPAILIVNLMVLAVSCLSLDIYTGRRYMYLSVFAMPFLLVHPPWTILHRLTIGLRTTALVVYVASAVSFRTPLAEFAERSVAQQFDERYDCLVGGGSHLSALIALNDLSTRTVDLDWRLRSNYSRNVEPTPEAIRDHCRQLFWIDANGRTAAAVQALCEPQPAFYTARPTGIVGYPQEVSFARCRVGVRR
jgi:hypothetical protein